LKTLTTILTDFYTETRMFIYEWSDGVFKEDMSDGSYTMSNSFLTSSNSYWKITFKTEIKPEKKRHGLFVRTVNRKSMTISCEDKSGVVELGEQSSYSLW
jgi:hypothetical protein